MAAFDFIAVYRTRVNCTAPKFSKKNCYHSAEKQVHQKSWNPTPFCFLCAFLFLGFFFDINVLLVFCVLGAEWFRKVEKRDAVHCVCEWRKYRHMWCGVDCGGVQRIVFTACRRSKSSGLSGVGGLRRGMSQQNCSNWGGGKLCCASWNRTFEYNSSNSLSFSEFRLAGSVGGGGGGVDL